MVKSKQSEVDDAIHELRTLANVPVFIENIKRHKFNWDLTWAAVDMVEDTELAIGSFEVGGYSADQGKEYLKIYGLFQAMFMQQDAVKNIAEGLQLPKVSIKDDADASDVREMRNKYFGHHKYERKKVITYHGISRMTVGSGMITAWTYPNFSTEDIDIRKAIKSNSEYIVSVLRKLTKDLRTKRENYVSKFSEELSEDTQGYAFEKLYSWVFGDSADKSVMAQASINILRGSIDKFEADVKARYENYSGFGDIERTANKAKHALKAVDNMYQANPIGMKGSFDAEIYVDGLQNSFVELIAVAKDINVEFKARAK